MVHRRRARQHGWQGLASAHLVRKQGETQSPSDTSRTLIGEEEETGA